MTRVLITGGTGFLGRGLLRRFAGPGGWDITVYSRDEYKQVLAAGRWPLAQYVLGDVLNSDRLLTVLGRDQYDLVIHTAAVKFIPEAELNVNEAIDVNITGTRNVLQSAGYAGVKQVVVISTDKACHPLNVYGASKMLAERMVGEFARYYKGRTKYTACRYGNVIGSTGSVIPLFARQAQLNKEITVTDPSMTRYWITVDQAVDLILDACAEDVTTGDVVIPTPQSMRLGDLAALFGVPVRTVGVRPGEKMHEQLLHEHESTRAEYNGRNYLLHSEGGGIYSEPFVLDSSQAEQMTAERMMAAIDDAKTV